MKKLVLKLIRGYQHVSIFQKLFSTGCRFYPTCSDYSYEAINTYGVLKGGVMSLYRIIRCNPWNKGGIDKVK